LRGGKAAVCRSRHREERSDEAIHSILLLRDGLLRRFAPRKDEPTKKNAAAFATASFSCSQA
jgi:hypothetical protein